MIITKISKLKVEQGFELVSKYFVSKLLVEHITGFVGGQMDG